MNKQRRESLSKIFSAIEAAKSDLETIRDEEQESFDNLSENLQGGERGQAMETAISTLEEAISSLEEACGHVEEAQT